MVKIQFKSNERFLSLRCTSTDNYWMSETLPFFKVSAHSHDMVKKIASWLVSVWPAGLGK